MIIADRKIGFIHYFKTNITKKKQGILKSVGNAVINALVKAQFRDINPKTNQVKANDKANTSATFISANEKITSMCIIIKKY